MWKFLGVERKAALTLIMTTTITDLDPNKFHLIREVSLGVFPPSNYLKT
jgi:hypothetical protein